MPERDNGAADRPEREPGTRRPPSNRRPPTAGDPSDDGEASDAQRPGRTEAVNAAQNRRAELAAKLAERDRLTGRHRPRPGGFPDCDDPFCEPPSAPAELIPEPVGATTASNRYASFIAEEPLGGLKLRVEEACLASLGETKSVVPGLFLSAPCPVVRLGYLAGHVQTWTSRGTALGEVVHSLSLAPGESRNIAMVDWRRRQRAARGETTDVGEELFAQEDHARALSEVTRAVAMEQQFGQTTTAANTMATAGAFVAAGAVVGGVAGGLIGTAVKPGLGTLIGAGVGGAAGVMAGGLVFSGANAIGKITAESSGDREVVARAHQRINQSTQQQAAAVRSLWSTIVVEDAQDEAIGVRSTNVTNYNHMHALNIEYFELLHRYTVITALDRVEPFVLIPFSALPEFDNEVVQRYWPTLRAGFDQVWAERGDQVFVSAPPVEPQPPGGDRPTEPEGLTGYALNMVNAEFELPIDGDLLSMLEKVLKTVTNAATLSAELLDDLFKRATLTVELSDGEPVELEGQRFVMGDMAATIAAFIGQALGVDTPQSGVKFKFLRDSLNIPADKVTGMRLVLRQAPVFSFDEQILRTLLGDGINYDFKLSQARIDHSSDGFSLNDPITRYGLELEYTGIGIAEDSFAWSPMADRRAGQQAEWAAYADANAPWADYDSALAAYQLRVAELAAWKAEILHRLNAERDRFTRILLSQNPGIVARVLDAMEIVARGAANTDAGLKLFQLVDTTPVGVTEQAVVLQMRTVPGWSGDMTDQRMREALKALFGGVDISGDIARFLMHPYRVLGRFEAAEKLTRSEEVFLPGQGLFAEAVLGRANSAEYINLRRYWNWQDSPIPHQAPAILPLAAGSFAQAPLATDPTVPQQTLQQVGPPSFPDPQGMAGVLQAIQNGDMFRDMSKADELTTIIGGLSDLAGKLGEQASSMTGDAAANALNSATEIGKTAASLAETFAKEAKNMPKPPGNVTEKAGTAEMGTSGGGQTEREKTNKVSKSLGIDPTGPPAGDRPPPVGGEGGSPPPTSVGGPAGPTVWEDWAIKGIREAVEQAETAGDHQPDVKEHLKQWYRNGLLPRLQSAGRNHHEALGAAGEYVRWYEMVQTFHDDDDELEALSAEALSEYIRPALVGAYDHLNAQLGTTDDLARDLAEIDDILSAYVQLGGEEYEPLNAEGVVTDLQSSPDIAGPGDDIVVSARIALKVADKDPVHGQEFWVTLRSEELVGKVRQGATVGPDGVFQASVRVSNNRRVVSEALALVTDSTQPNDVVIELRAAASHLPMVAAASRLTVEGRLDVELLGLYAEDADLSGPPSQSIYTFNGETSLIAYRVFRGLLPLVSQTVQLSLTGEGSLEADTAETNAEGVVYIPYTPPDSGEGTATVTMTVVSGTQTVSREFQTEYAAY